MAKHEKYDAVMLGNYFLYSSGVRNLRYTAYSLHRNVIPYYKVNDAYQCCAKILEELLHISHVIKIFMYYEDFMSMPAGDKKICQKLMENEFYLFSWPLEYMQKYPQHLIKQYPYLTNYMYELAENYRERYIPIPIHGIGYHEVFVRNFDDRKYTWCVPGNRNKRYYPERDKVMESLKMGSKKVWEDDPFQTLSVNSIDRKHMEWYQFRNKAEKYLSYLWKKDVHVASFPQMQYVGACREQYLESLRSTKLVYAEGSVGNCIVRKYFEACACGAVLVAKRIPGLSEMGFVHDKNCIVVDKYEDVMNIEKSYQENQLKGIAKAGQDLILNKHMYIHRAKALSQTLEVIIKGIYKGGFWENGNYVISE